MTYIRLDDRFPSHRKALAAGPYGRDLYVCGLAYCSLHLTDGVIPRTALGTIAAPPSGYTGRGVFAWSNVVRQTAELLVEVGLWEPIEGIGYRIHDYHEWNRSASQIAQLRTAKAEAGRNGGRRSAEARRKHAAGSGVAEAKQSGSLLPNPASTAAIPPYPPQAPASTQPHHDWPPGVSRSPMATSWSPGRWPYHAFNHDCPEPGMRGRCVSRTYADGHPGDFPSTSTGAPKQCAVHRETSHS